jgi:hypothetical protein
MKSIEQSLQSFVTPEILSGSNAYRCDACHQRCEASKGLKFTRLPYMLCLQLNRFYFDYETMVRRCCFLVSCCASSVDLASSRPCSNICSSCLLVSCALPTFLYLFLSLNYCNLAPVMDRACVCEFFRIASSYTIASRFRFSWMPILTSTSHPRPLPPQTLPPPPPPPLPALPPLYQWLKALLRMEPRHCRSARRHQPPQPQPPVCHHFQR